MRSQIGVRVSIKINYDEDYLVHQVKLAFFILQIYAKQPIITITSLIRASVRIINILSMIFE